MHKKNMNCDDQCISDVKNVAKCFDLLAHAHDLFLMNEPPSLVDNEIWEMITALLSYSNDKPILDIGTGNGIWSIRIAKLGYKVVAIDVSTAMLRIAQKNIDEAELSDRITLIHSDAHDLSFLEPCSFALVLAIGDLLNYSREPFRILEEIKRVCSPGGRILASVISKNGVLKRVLSDKDFVGAKRLIQTGTWEERSKSDISKKLSDPSKEAAALIVKTYMVDEISKLFKDLGIMVNKVFPLGIVSTLLNHQEFIEVLTESGSDVLIGMERMLMQDKFFLGSAMEIGIIGEI